MRDLQDHSRYVDLAEMCGFVLWSQITTIGGHDEMLRDRALQNKKFRASEQIPG